MKNIIVTGASSGIGFETARILANLGNRVIAIARSINKLEELKEVITNGEVISVGIDLSKNEDLEHLQKIVEPLESIHIIINNAGVLLNKPFFETSFEDWDFQFQVNLYGTLRVIHTAKNKLTEGSHIVNIGSMGGFQGADKYPGITAYSVSKGAVGVLSECLSAELAPLGISVNCLALGAVQTEMLEEAFPGYRAPTGAKEMGKYIANFALHSGSLINGKIIPVSLNNPG